MLSNNGFLNEKAVIASIAKILGNDTTLNALLNDPIDRFIIKKRLTLGSSFQSIAKQLNSPYCSVTRKFQRAASKIEKKLVLLSQGYNNKNSIKSNVEKFAVLGSDNKRLAKTNAMQLSVTNLYGLQPNCIKTLVNYNINTIEELTSFSKLDLQKFTGLSNHHINSIRISLLEFGLKLKK